MASSTVRPRLSTASGVTAPALTAGFVSAATPGPAVATPCARMVSPPMVASAHTKTCKESPAPEPDAKLDRIEQVLERFPDRVFAFDLRGPGDPMRMYCGSGSDTLTTERTAGSASTSAWAVPPP